MSVTVSALQTATIKGTQLVSVARVALSERGAEGDRRFFLADGKQRMRNAKQIGSLQQLVSGLEGDRRNTEHYYRVKLQWRERSGIDGRNRPNKQYDLNHKTLAVCRV